MKLQGLLLASILIFAHSRGVASDELPNVVSQGAKLELLYEADRSFEGPSWDPQTKKLYFTSFPTSFDPKEATHILRYDEKGKATIWLDKSEGINGTRLTRDGRLLGAQVWSHRIMSYKIGSAGPSESQVLYENGKLFQPNDVCEAPNGNIYFSDPDFEHGKNGAVYLLSASGKASKIVDLPMPNGLITSLDGSILYVGEDQSDEWLAFSLNADGSVGERKVFFKPDTKMTGKAKSDGMTIDEEGNLYFSGECCFPGKGGVWVVNPSGKSLGRIPTPEFCSNVAFGGDDGKTLFMTSKGKLYSLQMNVHGGQFNTSNSKKQNASKTHSSK